MEPLVEVLVGHWLVRPIPRSAVVETELDPWWVSSVVFVFVHVFEQSCQLTQRKLYIFICAEEACDSGIVLAVERQRYCSKCLCWGSEDAQRYACRRKIIDLVRLLTTVVIALTITRLVKLCAIWLWLCYENTEYFRGLAEIRSKYDRIHHWNVIEWMATKATEWDQSCKSIVLWAQFHRGKANTIDSRRIYSPVSKSISPRGFK